MKHPTSVPEPLITRSGGPILTPRPDVPWASEMVLNPAIYRATDEKRIHMLFRASGRGEPFAGHPNPFPICLGYAFSDDEGETWNADFKTPALFPPLKELAGELQVPLESGETAWNFPNGCIEDPRLFAIDGTVYLSAACRIFPPGPYWIHDDPVQCAPTWARQPDAPGGTAVRKNLTVSVLYRVDLAALADGRYPEAFAYLGALTDPEKSDNRDAFLFPERLLIDGGLKYVLVHRPRDPEPYSGTSGKPTMVISCAERLADLAQAPCQEQVLAAPLFPWEAERVGGSTPPIRIDDHRWLLPYHGKQDTVVGYTQSFLIVEQCAAELPRVTHRCPTRLFVAREHWEVKGKFATPCVFTCGCVLSGENLLMAYGAADTVCGLAAVNFRDLVAHVEQFDADGR